MTDQYGEILNKAKELNYTTEQYGQLEEVMAIARRARLTFSNFSERKIKDHFQFALLLTGATALYESYKALGNEGQIVYLNEKGQIVHHYADGRIKVIKERT